MPRELTLTIQFRVRRVDQRRLRQLARHYDLPASHVLRRLITEAHARLPSQAPQEPDTKPDSQPDTDTKES